MQRPRLLLAFLVLAVLVIAAAAYWYTRGAGSPPPTPGAVSGALIGGPFNLVDQNEHRVSDADLRGRNLLVFFGYTHCPDICPLGLETMSAAMDQLPPQIAARVQPVFITFDPARDTVAVMRDYVASFRPGFLALTGSEEEVKAALKGYRVYARKGEPGPDGSYVMDHSTFTYLMGPDGGYLTHFSHGTTLEVMATRIAELAAPAIASR